MVANLSLCSEKKKKMKRFYTILWKQRVGWVWEVVYPLPFLVSSCVVGSLTTGVRVKNYAAKSEFLMSFLSLFRDCSCSDHKRMKLWLRNGVTFSAVSCCQVGSLKLSFVVFGIPKRCSCSDHIVFWKKRLLRTFELRMV